MTSTAARPVETGRAALPWLRRPAGVTAGVLGTLALLAAAVAVVTVSAGGGWNLRAAHDLPVDVAVGVGYTAAGWLVLAGSGGRRLGLLLLVIGASGAGAALAGAVAVLAREQTAAASAAAFVYSWLWVPGFVPLLTLLPLIYPDGRLPSSRWRPAVLASVVGMVLLAGGAALYPESYVGRIAIAKPVTDRGVAEVMMVGAAVLLVPACLAGLAALVVRLRRSTGLVRRQVVVLLASAAVLLVDTALQPLLDWPVSSLTQSLAVALVPVAIGVAVTRHRLYDLDLAVCRAIGALSLALCLAGAYLTLFAVADAVLVGHGAVGAALAAAVTGLLVHPLGVRLNRGVDRLFYGDRGEPDVVLARLSSGLRAGLDLSEVPGHVCRGIVDSLRLGHASLVLGQDRDATPVFVAGTPTGTPEVLPLDHRGETVATLRVGLRPGETRLDPRDRELLEMVCDQVAPTIAALTLADRLQHSRAALVSAREEERLRLRRDLHDGVGAALAGLRLQVESARDLVGDPTARGLLESAASGVAGAVEDLRGISEDLRPPALDDLGLETCLHSLAERMSTPGTSATARVDVRRGLPAAVDVACYRIAAEALANAVRHSGARRVSLSLCEVPGGLVLEVADDGHGLPERIRPGALGLVSMRQRAEEIGGSLELLATPAGTTVRALLPLEGS